MTRLTTPFGSLYLLRPEEVISVGPSYAGNAKYKEPTRQITLSSGQNLYVSDTAENMAALVGDAFLGL